MFWRPHFHLSLCTIFPHLFILHHHHVLRTCMFIALSLCQHQVNVSIGFLHQTSKNTNTFQPNILQKYLFTIYVIRLIEHFQ